MMRDTPPPGSGFTLIEVMVATVLVGIVLALAIKGLSETKKIADLTRGKVVAAQEAQLGTQRIAKLLRRAHVIFFDARPIPNRSAAQSDAPPTTPTAVKTLLGSPPAILALSSDANILAPTGNVFLGSTGNTDYRTPFSAGTVGTTGIPRVTFRVQDLDGTPTSGTLLKTGLRGAGNAEPNRKFDRFFTSPLAYFGEAVFDTTAPAAGVQESANLPMTWTFYMFYLSPMRFEAGDGGDSLFPVQNSPNSPGHKRDLGQPLGWVRATVPYELRLLTIPDVLAMDPTNLGAAPLWGRKGPATGGVYSFPYDVPKDKANYDPIALSYDSTGVNELNGAHPDYGNASAARVLGAVHGNWDNIGNDPPNAGALQQRRTWTGTGFAATANPVTDTSIARYIDPDAVHGTFVRLANDWGLRNEDDLATDLPRPYVNAYGGPQRLNPRIWNGLNPSGALSPPRRALVSVTTRYRNTRQIPFAFATESVEVDLEALVRFQDFSYRKRR